MFELFGNQIIEDRNIFADGVILFPGRGFHFIKTGAHNDFNILTAQPARCAATIHGRITATQNNDAFADLRYMLKRNIGQPVDTNMDMGACFLPARNEEIPAFWCTGPDKNGIIGFVEKFLEAINTLSQAHFGAHGGDIAHFFV